MSDDQSRPGAVVRPMAVDRVYFALLIFVTISVVCHIAKAPDLVIFCV